MFNYELYEAHNIYGMFYHFPKRGDGLGMHKHEPEQEHNVMVMRGSINIYGPDYAWIRTLKAGDVMEPPYGEEHEIVALEDDTLIMGMFLHGKPEGENVPPEYRKGSLDLPEKAVTLPIIDVPEASD